MKSYWDYLIDHKLAGRNIFEVRSRREKLKGTIVKPTEALTREEVVAILKLCNKNKDESRRFLHLAILHTFLGTGMRISETNRIKIKVGDVKLNTQILA